MTLASPRQVRGWRVVEKILDAALEELSLKGYGLLSIEEVAERAGVAKTTVYRRWPTKAHLALDACRRLADDVLVISDTGSLRGDLLALMKTFRAMAATPRGQSLMKMLLVEGPDAEVSRLAKKIRASKESEPLAVVHRAIERGELPRGTNARLVLDVLFGALEHYIFFMHDRCSNQKLEQIVELVIVGAANGGARHPSRSLSTPRSMKPMRRPRSLRASQ